MEAFKAQSINMHPSKLSVLCLAAFIASSQSQDSQTLETPNQSRRYNPMTNGKVYNQMQNNFPMLAYIIPINGHMQKISHGFTGYIYPTSVSTFYNPYYTMLCQKDLNSEPTSSSATTERQFGLINNRMTELSENMKNLANIFENKFKTPINTAERKERKQPKTSQAPLKSIERTATNQPPISTPPTSPPAVALPPISPNIVQEQVASSEDNVNVQSNVFQCESVKCTKLTESCKVVDRSVEPNHDEIIRSVMCFSRDGDVLKEVDDRFPNPKKGSSMNSSKTYNKNDQTAMAKASEQFNKAMKHFDQQIKTVFGQVD